MSHDLSWMKLTGDIRTGVIQSVQTLFTQHSQNTKHLWNTWVVWDWLCCRRIFECATQNWPNHAESLFQNSLCQLADFRQQGGLSFVIPVTLYRKGRNSRQHNTTGTNHRPSLKSAIYYDAQIAILMCISRTAHPAVDIYERIYR